MLETILSVLMGILFGAQAALFGYLADNNLPKSWSVIFTKSFWESFSPMKAAKTMILGGIMGALGIFQTLNLMSSAEGIVAFNFASAIAILGLNKFIQMIVRRTPIVTYWNKLKLWMLNILDKPEVTVQDITVPDDEVEVIAEKEQT